MARTEGRRVAYRVLVGRLKKGDHLEDLGVNGRIILKMEHQKEECGDMDWIAVTEGRDK